MNKLILILMVFSGCVQGSPGYMVFGDSQSMFVADTGEAAKNWPNLLELSQNAKGETLGMHFFNYSKGGRKLSDGHVAEVLRVIDANRNENEIRGIIIALGSIDAWFELDVLPALTDAIEEAQSRNLEVICLLPPENSLGSPFHVREVLAENCPEYIDMSQYLGPDDMVTEYNQHGEPYQVHFGAEGHKTYAMAVFWNLLFKGKFND